MKYIDITNPIKIPASIAECPECFGPLWVEVTEWEPESGEITEAGFDIHCNREEADPDSHPERWVSQWHRIENKIYHWLLDNVRVAKATKRHLEAWTEAVKDWQR